MAIDPVIQKSVKYKNIKILNEYIEKINIKKIFEESNIIILRHTLEHLANPKKLLKKIFKNIPPNCKVVIEVPNFDLMLKRKRYDAIIHQHYYYFDKKTISNLIKLAGGYVLNFENYNSGPCGGSMMICCTKLDNRKYKLEKVDIKKKIIKIKESIKQYKIKMKKIKLKLDNEKNIYGFGAGLMLPTFIYHMRYDITKLNLILDDNPKKNNFSYKNLNTKVVSTNNFIPKPNSNFLITSLENIDKIKKRIKKLKPKRIYTV